MNLAGMSGIHPGGAALGGSFRKTNSWICSWSVLLVISGLVNGCAASRPAPVEGVVVPDGSLARSAAAAGPVPTLPKPPPASPAHSEWSWPLPKSQAGPYNSRRLGISFTTHPRQPVLCIADGVVTYVGNGIKDYGQMIIVKHGTDFLSVYAKNGKVLVREGQAVKKGENLALSKTEPPGLIHFEIRHFGKPVDPSKWLP